MKIDDIVEQLIALRSQYGNISIVIADQSSSKLFCAGMRMEHRVVYGQEFYNNFSDTPISGDKAMGVVVVLRQNR
tara:strand:+ start:1407 stop:1631 length:225 start_codon:yes stop_codon:yes gene_type:complete